MNRIILSAALAVAVIGCRSQQSPTQAAPAASRPTTTMAAVASTQPQTLEGRLHAILNRLAKTGAVVSARVIDPETGEELYAQDANRPVIPASNMKLTVTSAVLDFFGPDAVFETKLMVAGQDLWLVGTGDTATGDEQIAKKYGKTGTSLFDTWADELAAKGITTLSGNLYYVDNAFEKTQTHPTWDDDDLVEWYAAPVSGLNLNDNCIDGYAVPGSKPGEPAKIEVYPKTTASVVIVNQTTTAAPGAATGATTGATTGPASDVDWTRELTQNVYTVKGAVSKSTKLQSKPVIDPGAFFADALRTHLAARGITITGATVRGDAPPTGTVMQLAPATTKLADVLDRINKNSQNLLAEGAAKLLGRAYEMRESGKPSAVGSWSNADTAIRAFWRKNKIDDRGFAFADGSGLSRDNKVTTRLISDILLAMYRHPHFETFMKSLTIAGVDGTTRNRLKDLPNRVFCKTGYIGGVRSLSGYVKTDSGKLRIFSIIYNNIPGRGQGSTKPYEELQDEALRVLMKD